MKPSSEQLVKIRMYATQQVLDHLPFCRDCSHDDKSTHRQRYDEIVSATGYKWNPGATGTTCGYLCHWMLWTIGATNKTVVNWTDTARGTKYTYGSDNISKLYNGGKSPFVLMMPPKINSLEANPMIGGPQPGDIILIQKFDSDNKYVVNSDHVFVYLSNRPDLFDYRTDMARSATPPGATGSPLIWVTGESGQGPKGQSTDGLLKSRRIDLTGKSNTKTSLEDSEYRTITGYVSLAELDYDPAVVEQISAEMAEL